jgi:opacity protein-like surface antigen
MKITGLKLAMIACLSGAYCAVAIADTNSSPETYSPPRTIKLEPEQTDYLNRFGVNYRMGLNMSVDFRHLGGLGLSNPGPQNGSAVDRRYDNGYNLVDSSTNAGGLTWNWGYNSANSVQGGNLVLQSDATSPNARSDDRRDDPQHGFEITYQRELIRRKHWRAGIEVAGGYSFISIKDSRTLFNTVYRTNDAFNLSGIIPPPPGYQGSSSNTAALLSSEPSSRTVETVPNAATITGDRSIDSHVFTIRLGPYLEVPVNDRLSLFVDGGLAMAVAQTKFSFHETVTISDPTYDINLTSGPRSGSGTQTDFLVGGYVEGGISYAFNKHWSAVGAVEFQAAGREINHVQGKESVLNLNKSCIISVGLTYAF